MSKHEQFAALAPNFLGRRGLLVEFGPKITGCKVLDLSCDARGLDARIRCDDGTETEFGGAWEIVIFDPDFWQVSYANSRIVFDAEAVRRFDAGEPFDIGDYL